MAIHKLENRFIRCADQLRLATAQAVFAAESNGAPLLQARRGAALCRRFERLADQLDLMTDTVAWLIFDGCQVALGG